MQARRRRVLTRFVPLSILGLAAFVAGALVGDRSPGREAADRFASAWAREDYEAMRAELTDSARRRYSLERFRRLNEEARETATVRSIDPGDPEDPETVSGEDVVTVPVEIDTRAFGEVRGELALPVSGEAIEWEPHLTFPGLAPGERLARRAKVPERAPILARDGAPLAKGPALARASPLGAAALDIAGQLGVPKPPEAARLARLGFPEGTLAGVSGLELAFNDRLAGQPGGELVAVGQGADSAPRTLAAGSPRAGKPVHTTIDPVLQQAAVSALGDLFGGVAVLDARDGSVRALAGIAFSAPQPPGSTFKVVTTVAALEAGVVNLDDSFPVETSHVVGGREIANAHDEACGGTFVQSFAHSCNSVFAPLGPKIGGERLVETAERFGFNSRPKLYDSKATAIVDPPASTIPEAIGTDLEVGVSAIGQGQVLATPLELASISQTIAAGGKRTPTSIVTDRALKPDASSVDVTSPRVAATVADLMVEVVASGTGTAAAIPGVTVAGKTGTAELGAKAPEPGEMTPKGEEPEQEVDAWFTAFAPADKPRLAVGVMIVNAEGDGGEIAAPIAQEVLAAGVSE